MRNLTIFVILEFLAFVVAAALAIRLSCESTILNRKEMTREVEKTITLDSISAASNLHLNKVVVFPVDRVFSIVLIKEHHQLVGESGCRFIAMFTNLPENEFLKILTQEQIESISGVFIQGVVESIDSDDGGTIVRIKEARVVQSQ